MILPVIVESHPSSTSGCVLCSACSIGEVSLDNRTSCIECDPGGWSSVFSPAHYLILTCSNRSLPALRGWSQVHAVSSWYSLQVSLYGACTCVATLCQHVATLCQHVVTLCQHVAAFSQCIAADQQYIATYHPCRCCNTSTLHYFTPPVYCNTSTLYYFTPPVYCNTSTLYYFTLLVHCNTIWL